MGSTSGISQHIYPQIILFGDSITQHSEATFAAALRIQYSRRADVINRGFSGYTTPLALDVLSRFFPNPSQAHVRWMVVFFGANDACLPGSVQHVPLETYIACLRAIVQHQLVKNTKVVLITPGPVNEWQLAKDERKADNTKKYAEACRKLGAELGLPVVDLWSTIMKKAGWQEGSPLIGTKAIPSNPVLEALLPDGLHFAPDAYTVLFDALMNVIKRDLPEELPDRLPYVFPEYSTLLK